MYFSLLENYVSKSHSSIIGVIGQLIFFLVCFAAIVALAYLSARYIGRMKAQTMTGKNISIAESVNLGIGAALYLIKAGEQYFLISVSKESIRLISEIDAQTIKEVGKQEPTVFENLMKEYFDKFGKYKK